AEMIDEQTKNIIAVCDFYFLQEDGGRFKVIKLKYFDVSNKTKKKITFYLKFIAYVPDINNYHLLTNCSISVSCSEVSKFLFKGSLNCDLWEFPVGIRVTVINN
ncbi:hypothetical protein WUBG_15086, partial [Wuchereria bancrofti]